MLRTGEVSSDAVTLRRVHAPALQHEHPCPRRNARRARVCGASNSC